MEEIKQKLAELGQTERRDFRVSVYPQVEQRQWLGEVRKQIVIRQHTLSATSLPTQLLKSVDGR